MDFEQVEHHFRQLQKQRDRGELEDDLFRVEVAKLLLRDGQGVFWMLDADEGTWFRNRGEGWAPGDPRAESLPEAAQPKTKWQRWGRVLALSGALIILLGMLGVVVLRQWPQQWPAVAWNPFQPTATPDIRVQVAIASPDDGSQAALGQEVAVESTVGAEPGLSVIDRVELQVNDQVVEARPVRSRAQPGQTSLPLSLPWLPTAAGEYQVKVIALSGEGHPLGEAGITLYVTEAPSEALPEAACIPGATFVTDVTIPSGTAFPPGARMDKVWQVRNSGSCAWGVGYELVWVAGKELDAANAVPVPPTAAGEMADLTVSFRSPDSAGVYSSTWQLQSPGGELFGPTLMLSVEVEARAKESLPPNAPTRPQATITSDGKAVQLTWQDRSDSEDAFRVYREDVEASIGLAPANAELFVDEAVTCGNTYRYGVVAFNATGASPLSETAEVTLPPCAPADAPPTLLLTVVPTQVRASEIFTIAFQADDDLGVTQIIVWGEETGYPDLDAGRVFTCAGVMCANTWPITWTAGVSTTLTLVAIASDSSGQESEPAWTTVFILPPE